MRILFFFLLISKITLSQNVDGLGILKIGADQSDIIKQLGGNVIIVNNNKENDPSLQSDSKIISKFPRNPESSIIYKIEKTKQAGVWPSYGKTSFVAGFHNNCNLFFIKEYQYQNILVKNVFLVFQHEKLKMIEPDGSSEIYSKLVSLKSPESTNTAVDSILCQGQKGVNTKKIKSVTFSAKWKDNLAEITYVSRPSFDINCNPMTYYRLIFIDSKFFDYLGKNPLSDMKKSYSK